MPTPKSKILITSISSGVIVPPYSEPCKKIISRQMVAIQNTKPTNILPPCGNRLIPIFLAPKFQSALEAKVCFMSCYFPTVLCLAMRFMRPEHISPLSCGHTLQSKAHRLRLHAFFCFCYTEFDQANLETISEQLKLIWLLALNLC